ncbi:MAG: hypothetical protein Q7K34_04070 [archaeon]|nr:hypothetical protein [archaeon]
MNFIASLAFASVFLLLAYTAENFFLQTVFFLLFAFFGLYFLTGFLKAVSGFLKGEQAEVEAAQGSYPDVKEIYGENVKLLVGKKPHKKSWTQRIFAGAEEFVEEVTDLFK